MVKSIEKKPCNVGAPVRLYQRGKFTGFRRARMSQNSNQALVQVESCNDKASAKFYLGKRVAYIYKVKNTSNNTRYRCMWGKSSTPTARPVASAASSPKTSRLTP